MNFSNRVLEESHRELINSHLNENLWLRFGTNLMLGKLLDNNSDKYQSTFLPIYLKEEIGNSYLNGIPLVKSEQALNTINKKNIGNFQNWISPVVTFSILFLIFLFWFPRSVELTVISLIGGIGLVLSLMWLFSDHPEVRDNFNILWCNPLYLMYIPLMIKDKSNFTLALVLLLTLLCTPLVWILKIQTFDIAIIPVLLILGLVNYKQIRRKKVITTYKNNA